MEDRITIREMEEGDVPRVQELVEELNDVFKTGHDISPVAIRATFRTMLDDGRTYRNWVARAGDRVVGFISTVIYKTFFHPRGTLLINELVVEQAVRGKRIGGCLLNAAFEYARALGLNEIEVGTTYGNTGAISFYKKNGLVDESIILGKELNV